MSYYSNYEGYKPLYCESDNDDIRMILHGRHMHGYAQQGCYQDNRNHSYRSRSWNEEPSITEEMEQPEMSNLERLLKEAIEQTERQSRELDEIFDWNIESDHERPYDTFTNANEHADDVEAIEYNDYYSNVDVAYSSNFVFQDDSDDEMDEEEEENEVTNYPQGTSQSVLQDLHTLEPEVTEDSDLEESDDEEEELEEEVVEISVMPIFEVASMPAESTTENEELKKEVVSIDNELEHEVVLEDQILPKLEDLTLDEELQLLLGFDDEDLNILKNSTDGMMTEEELLEIMGLKVEETHPLDVKLENLREDDMLCIKNSLETSPTNLKPNTLPCESEFELVKEPKPPDSFIPASKDLVLLKDVDELKTDTERGIWCNWVSNKCITTHIGSDIYGLLDDPGDIEMVISFSLDIACGGNLKRYCGIIQLIDKPPESNWRVATAIWEMYYKNDIKIDNILPCEYDWKGAGIMMEDPPMKGRV